MCPPPTGSGSRGAAWMRVSGETWTAPPVGRAAPAGLSPPPGPGGAGGQRPNRCQVAASAGGEECHEEGSAGSGASGGDGGAGERDLGGRGRFALWSCDGDLRGGRVHHARVHADVLGRRTGGGHRA